ncbi:MAG: hypothetical protein QG604_428 [Candidatus Dependentiae bacterium]|nr:hypothetical protein [Candidatus Dependentiae bacterium]
MSIKITTYDITVVPYNPTWPTLFAEEAAHIREALGENCIEIHHIGSTSVPGLAAKPVIDILVGVKDLRAIDRRSTDKIIALGYEDKAEYGIPLRHFFYKQRPIRTHNLHIYEQGYPEIERHLKFRDWLRNHEPDRLAYATLKQQLALQYPRDIIGYGMGKEAFVHHVEALAGFNKPRFLFPYTEHEWNEYYRISDEQPKHHGCFASSEPQFILYKGLEIIAIAFEKAISIDEPYKGQGYEALMAQLLERWYKFHAQP